MLLILIRELKPVYWYKGNSWAVSPPYLRKRVNMKLLIFLLVSINLKALQVSTFPIYFTFPLSINYIHLLNEITQFQGRIPPAELYENFDEIRNLNCGSGDVSDECNRLAVIKEDFVSKNTINQTQSSLFSYICM